MKDNCKTKNPLKIKQMKRFALSNYICCSGEIYKLFSLKFFQKLAKEVDNDIISISSSVIYGKDYLTLDENFLLILDKYIGYIRDTYNIKHYELVNIISETLKNKYNQYLYVKKCVHSNYEEFMLYFKRMFLANLYQNTIYYANIDKSKSFEGIQNAYIYLKDLNIENNNDLIKIETFFIKVINNINDNLYECFVLYENVLKNKMFFYMFKLDELYDNYFSKEGE